MKYVWRVNGVWPWKGMAACSNPILTPEEVREFAEEYGCIGFSPIFITRAAAEAWPGGCKNIQRIELGDEVAPPEATP